MTATTVVMRRLSIVIVDEHTADRPVFQRLAAEFANSHVLCFPSLDAAGNRCAAHAPDIFIIDDTGANHVPRSFEPHLRERPGLLHALIVLLVAHDRPLGEQSRSNGIDLCLPKPVNTLLFMAVLHEAVKLRDARLAIAIERVTLSPRATSRGSDKPQVGGGPSTTRTSCAPLRMTREAIGGPRCSCGTGVDRA